MRKKAFPGVAILAVGVLATWLGQTSSPAPNVVGYYNVTLQAGQKRLIANQLHTTNDVLSNVLRGPYADGTTFFHFDGTFAASPWDTDANAWSADFSLKPGEGGFLFSQAQQTITFVGEVPQGSITNTPLKRAQKNIRGYPVPVPILLSNSGLTGEDGDTVFQFHGTYSTASYDTDAGEWTVDLSNQVGEAWFIYKQGSQTNWVVNFTVQ